MLLKHYFLEKIAHSSYILAGKQSCAVVDPRRDVDMYINEARDLGVTITHILETHLHADFVSGHMDLAARTGARIYAPGPAGALSTTCPCLKVTPSSWRRCAWTYWRRPATRRSTSLTW